MIGNIGLWRNWILHWTNGRTRFRKSVSRRYSFRLNPLIFFTIVRWDPIKKDSTFFDHTVLLYSTFFYIQIQVHRPFLTKKSDLSLVSLAICTNAARSCIHLLEVALARGLVFSPIIFVELILITYVSPDIWILSRILPLHLALSSFSTCGEVGNAVCCKTWRKRWRMSRFVSMFSRKAKKGTFYWNFQFIISLGLTHANIDGILLGVCSERDYNPPMSIDMHDFLFQWHTKAN